MLLKHKMTGKLVEVSDMEELTDPDIDHLTGCLQWGEQFPEHESFQKLSLIFPSGEELPKCWSDENFREDDMVDRRGALSYLTDEADSVLHK